MRTEQISEIQLELGRTFFANVACVTSAFFNRALCIVLLVLFSFFSSSLSFRLPSALQCCKMCQCECRCTRCTIFFSFFHGLWFALLCMVCGVCSFCLKAIFFHSIYNATYAVCNPVCYFIFASSFHSLCHFVFFMCPPFPSEAESKRRKNQRKDVRFVSVVSIVCVIASHISMHFNSAENLIAENRWDFCRSFDRMGTYKEIQIESAPETRQILRMRRNSEQKEIFFLFNFEIYRQHISKFEIIFSFVAPCVHLRTANSLSHSVKLYQTNKKKREKNLMNNIWNGKV